MSVEHHREREVTFDVDDDWSVPDLSSMVPDGGRVETTEYDLSATYYDTERSTLRLLGLTLRYREGGEDAGWHLKIPAGDARTEVQSQAAPGALPAALRRRVAGVVGDDSVRPVATIRTTRAATRLRDADDAVVVEIADDRVTGTPTGADAYDVVWREVEVELGPAGDEDDLDAVVGRFDGARPAAIERKITHVLGTAPATVPDGLPGVVVTYVRDQCAAVLVGDVRLRDDPTPEVVHDTRVGIRRLRSTLRLFDHVVAGPPEGLDDDLKWMANLLSPIRDADILSHRVGEAVDDPTREEVERELSSIRDAAKREWQAAWDDPRYRGVMATLVRWYASVPVGEDVRVRPKKTLRKARKKVRRRLARATDAHGLHQARKAAKRLRYAADLLEPALPKAAKVSDDAKELQTTLGEHQDLAVAAAFVRELGGSGRVESPDTYAQLADRFDRDAAQIRSSLTGR
ncbi:MAG TPA: CYTH and CHAD domain-containing protein [Lapillicoccus sp.]|nr:CYTH and CHAD domain-containing protein [Lapillicoccus sp.]